MLLCAHPFMKRSRTVPPSAGRTFLQEEALFIRALELPVAARACFLATACRDDPTLKNRVRALLRAHERAEGFLDPPAVVCRRKHGSKKQIRA